MRTHKWSMRNDKTGRVVDTGVAQCLKCGIYRQYVKGNAEFWRGDNHLSKRPDCVV
jgi:hypothetical protein